MVRLGMVIMVPKRMCDSFERGWVDSMINAMHSERVILHGVWTTALIGSFVLEELYTRPHGPC